MSAAQAQVEKTRQARFIVTLPGFIGQKILQHPPMALLQTAMAVNAVPIPQFAECKLFIMITILSNFVSKQIHKSIIF